MKARMMVWHSVADGDLPEKSGEYLALTTSGNYASLLYSAYYKAFNCYDKDTQERAEFTKIAVTYWTELPNLNKK